MDSFQRDEEEKGSVVERGEEEEGEEVEATVGADILEVAPKPDTWILQRFGTVSLYY